VDDARITPIYTQHEASDLIGTSTSTFNRWARGYLTAGGNFQQPFVTAERGGRGYTVPFTGLAEAWIVRAFTRAGLPLRRIRPALERLRTEIGLEHALASDRLKTDGAEILWELRTEHEPVDDRLVVVRNGQAAFGEIVREHLRQVDYRDGFVGQLRIPRAHGADITVDPRVNYGRPTLSEFGVRVDDVLGRLRGGEQVEDVAADYDIPPATVSSLALAVA